MKKNSGFTLIELMIAFFILILIIGGIVGLLSTSLRTWSQTESNKELYDRAQFILDQIANDMRNVYAEIDTRNATSAPFLGDWDRQGRQRLRWVRTGTAEAMNIPRPFVPAKSPYGMTDLFEVAYVMDPDPRLKTLWRGVAFYTGDANSIFQDRNVDDKRSAAFTSRFSPLDTRVLLMDFSYWAPLTNTWDDRIRVVSRMDSKQGLPVGPSLIWDSTRRKLDAFVLHLKGKVGTPRLEDPVYPRHVRIRLLLSDADGGTGPKLLQPMDDKQTKIEVDLAKRLPPVPLLVRIEQEWCEIGSVQGNAVVLTRRGLRGTSAVAHPAGATVDYGTEFTSVVTLPVYKDYLLLGDR